MFAASLRAPPVAIKQLNASSAGRKEDGTISISINADTPACTHSSLL